MKRVIVALLVGVLIGSAAVAGAAGYWEKNGRTYHCYGDQIRLFCKETNWKPSYEVGIMPSQIAVTFQGSVIFRCVRGIRPNNNCLYFGR